MRLEQLTATIGTSVIASVDATVSAGEVLTILGPSGSGKSTILSAISGTQDPAVSVSGRIILNGRDVTNVVPHLRRVGVLFQDPLLFPHMSVGANLAFGLAPNLTDRKARVEAALEDIGMGGFSDRDPATLSGGQKARVSLMRVLLSEPQALLLDEPFSSLDQELRERIRQLVFEHARGLPTILVTHDLSDAKAAGGKEIHL